MLIFKKIISVILGILVIVALLQMSGILDMLWHAFAGGVAVIGAIWLCDAARFTVKYCFDEKYRRFVKTGC